MTERYVTIKTEGNIPDDLKDSVSFQITDGNIEAVVVKVGEAFLRIVKSDSYGSNLKVLTNAPKKEVTKYRIVGEFLGVASVNEVFTSKSDADDKYHEFKQKAGWDEEFGLKIEEFTELVDEDKL